VSLCVFRAPLSNTGVSLWARTADYAFFKSFCPSFFACTPSVVFVVVPLSPDFTTIASRFAEQADELSCCQHMVAPHVT
jgi:hypothetical protein